MEKDGVNQSILKLIEQMLKDFWDIFSSHPSIPSSGVFHELKPISKAIHRWKLLVLDWVNNNPETPFAYNHKVEIGSTPPSCSLSEPIIHYPCPTQTVYTLVIENYEFILISSSQTDDLETHHIFHVWRSVWNFISSTP